jgi:hypothetical protein
MINPDGGGGGNKNNQSGNPKLKDYDLPQII